MSLTACVTFQWSIQGSVATASFSTINLPVDAKEAAKVKVAEYTGLDRTNTQLLMFSPASAMQREVKVFRMSHVDFSL